MTTKTGFLQPLYFDPQYTPWTPLSSNKSDHPDVPAMGIINPASGVGNTPPTSDFLNAIGSLQDVDVKVLGYIPTAWGARDPVSLNSEIKKYRKWYPGLDGIFLDEMESTAGEETYYSNISKNCLLNCMSITVGNPGTSPASSYIGTVDIMQVREGAGVQDLSYLASTYPGVDKYNFEACLYDVPTLTNQNIEDMAEYVGWLYITPDPLVPNPYNSISSYIAQIFDVLDTL